MQLSCPYEPTHLPTPLLLCLVGQKVGLVENSPAPVDTESHKSSFKIQALNYGHDLFTFLSLDYQETL